MAMAIRDQAFILLIGFFVIVSSSSNSVSARIVRQTDNEDELARNSPPESSVKQQQGDYNGDGDGGDFEEQPLGLPSNSTSIRSNIVDTFSCEDKQYGYYADVDNDCQIFHICLPVKFPDDTEKVYRWSFICPAETIFNQESFTCARSEDAVPCADAPSFYYRNDEFGVIPDRALTPEAVRESTPTTTDAPARPERSFRPF